MPVKKLFLIDGHALCYRSFYAIRELSNSKGEPTNAVFGFVNTLRKILRDQKPDYLAVCFDSKGKTHRQDLYKEYKIQRPSMPEGLISQIPVIKKVLKAYNIAIFEEPGYEADDLIGTLVKKHAKDSVKITIVSDDKDMFQLSSPGVFFYSARKDQVFDRPALKKKLGFMPEQIVDFLALAGDKSDNVPGVSGIGDVTARELVKKFGSLEDIYQSVEKVEKPKVREKLESEKEMALLSKKLILLDCSAPIKSKVEGLGVADPDEKRLHELFSELEFRRLADEYGSSDAPATDVQIKKLAVSKEISELTQQINQKGLCAFLLLEQSEGTLFTQPALLISVDGVVVYEVALKSVGGLKKIFADKKIVKITYDYKSVLKRMAPLDFVIEAGVFDIKLAAYLTGFNYSSNSPSDLVWRYLKRSISDNNKTAQEAAALPAMYEVLYKELSQKCLLKLHDELEIPLSVVLFKMEQSGVALNVSLLGTLSKDCAKKIISLEKKLYKLAGEEFNLNSPKQLSKILFEKLKLPAVKKTKTGFSTDESVLNALSQQHEVPGFILEYRQLAKLKSTYIDALPKMTADDGRIHAEFDQIGAETGRFASRNPNLQNIPIRTELGREIRKAFIPSQKSNVLISADYSQIELRMLAHLSGDPSLIKAFEDDQDIHNLTASVIFGVKEKDVSYHMRDTAKRINFGIIYGMSSFGLAKDLKITTSEAQAFIDTYFSRHPKVREFLDNAIKECEREGYATTILNRRRYIADINSRNNAVKQFAQRQATNTPVQGSAADLMKLAMINVQAKMETKKFGSRMIMTVHDELVFDALKSERDDVIHLVRNEMESPMELSVPIKVSVKTGPNWLETEEVA